MISELTTTIYVGIGSNVGRRTENIRAAVELLRRTPRVKVLRLSPLYLTSPVGPRQRDFVNAAAKIATSLSPRELLSTLKAIEKKLGRKRTRRWGPRVLDLDILFYGKKTLKSRALTIPHPRLHGRLFVLAPLAAIAPRLRHPLLKISIQKLYNSALLTIPDQKVRIVGKKGS